jgi:hypothetical protein
MIGTVKGRRLDKEKNIEGKKPIKFVYVNYVL